MHRPSRSFLPLLALLAATATACLEASYVTSEDNLAARCSAAGDALRSCTGDSSEEFEEACLADPSEDTFAIVDDMVDSGCAGRIDSKSDGAVGETLFASQCMGAMGAAALVSRLRNNGADGLNAADKALLRREFGDLVDQVNFYFNARIIDEWNLGLANIQFSFDVYAQTLGTRIYVDDDYRPGNRAQLATLAHELQHARQSVRAGGFYPGFAYTYCVALYRADFSYNRNALEVEAREVGSRF